MSRQTLHTLHCELDLVSAVAASEDSILFLENGIYAARQFDRAKIDSSINLYVLEADLLARGFDKIEGIVTVDYEGFVRLCTQHMKVISW